MLNDFNNTKIFRVSLRHRKHSLDTLSYILLKNDNVAMTSTSARIQFKETGCLYEYTTFNQANNVSESGRQKRCYIHCVILGPADSKHILTPSLSVTREACFPHKHASSYLGTEGVLIKCLEPVITHC
jgi:hypothetical protein